MSRRERLRAFLAGLLEEHEIDLEGPLRDDRPLISSGTLDSLAILSLAEWIDGELGGRLDLGDADIVRDWDSVDSVLRFVENRR